MRCPRCPDSQLGTADASNTRHCTTCGGVYIARDGIERLVTSARDPAVRQETGARLQSWLASPQFVETDPPIACPQCRYNMYLVASGGVELDFCLNCEGMWFDRGELDTVYERLRTGELTTLTPGSVAEDDHDAALIVHMLGTIIA